MKWELRLDFDTSQKVFDHQTLQRLLRTSISAINKTDLSHIHISENEKMPRLQLWALAELWTLHQLQQCAINFAPQHRAYQNTLLRPASKYRSNLGVCQNTAGASGLPDGASRLSGACARRGSAADAADRRAVKQRRVWFWAGPQDWALLHLSGIT